MGSVYDNTSSQNKCYGEQMQKTQRYVNYFDLVFFLICIWQLTESERLI